MDDWEQIDGAKDDQGTDLAETPEQGNQSSRAFPPSIANILFPFKASDIYEPSVVNKKTTSVSLLNRVLVLLAQIDKQAEN